MLIKYCAQSILLRSLALILKSRNPTSGVVGKAKLGI